MSDEFHDSVVSVAERLLVAVLRESVRRVPHAEREEPPAPGVIPPDLRQRLDSFHEIAAEAVHMVDGWLNQAVTNILNETEIQSFQHRLDNL